MVSPGRHIPVYRPRLPSANALRPYLETLDQTRIYSNYGPLERRFAASMDRLLGFDAPVVATASSGTAALTGAILAHAGRASGTRPLCLCPAYTFVATVAAVELCGYVPHLIDVDQQTWEPSPDALLTHPALGKVGLVVITAAYGRAVRQQPWQRFEEHTGIPVVIDGAASLENLADAPGLYLGPIPAALSFHATKVFATGEGGAVVTTDADLLKRSIQAMNFGFYGTRRSDTVGFNGKMSEYHAAVGLAELDGWADKRAGFGRVRDLYRDVARQCGLDDRLVTAPSVASTYVLFESASVPEADAVRVALTEVDVEHRSWYGLGVHREPYFAGAARDALSGVEGLAPRLIGLPVALDLTASDVERIIGAVARGRDRVGH